MNKVWAIFTRGIAVTMIIPIVPTVIVHPFLLAESTRNSEIKTEADPVFRHSRQEQIDQRVNEFFLRFERANSSSDVSEMSALYADTFIFGGPNGVQVVKREDFLKVLPRMKAHFSSMGLSGTQLQAVEASPLDSKYLLAKVVWTIEFRDPSRNNHVDASSTYVLVRGDGNALSIVLQIDHQDLASLIKEQQSPQQ